MAKGTFQVSAKRLLGLCLIIFSAVSCTYDYFVDENNFMLHVPQIENNEISCFYVAFHDASGAHVRTRQIEAPFDKDDFMKQGILRFKLSPGQYSVSCFAEYASGSITEGESFADSYKAYERHSSDGQDDHATRIYKPRNTNPRAMFFDATVYPLGHPEAKKAVATDIDETKRFKGSVTTKFIDLPASIKYIDIASAGLATKFKFDGTFDNFISDDRIILTSGAIESASNSSDISLTHIINPSTGINFTNYLSAGAITGARSMELEVRFYNADNVLIGTSTISDADIAGLEPDKKPTDESGNPLTSLILEPQKEIIFTFKGFSLFQV